MMLRRSSDETAPAPTPIANRRVCPSVLAMSMTLAIARSTSRTLGSSPPTLLFWTNAVPTTPAPAASSSVPRCTESPAIMALPPFGESDQSIAGEQQHAEENNRAEARRRFARGRVLDAAEIDGRL